MMRRLIFHRSRTSNNENEIIAFRLPKDKPSHAEKTDFDKEKEVLKQMAMHDKKLESKEEVEETKEGV